MSNSNTRHFLKRLNNSKLVRYLLLLALGWAIVQILAYFQTVIVIFIFAAILAFLLNYPVQWLCRFLPHGVAVGLVFLLSLILIGGIGITLGLAVMFQAEQLINQSNNIVQSVFPIIEQLEKVLQNWNIQVDFRVIEDQIRNQILSGLGISLVAIQSWVSNLIDLILIAVVAFFMLLDGEKIWNFLMKAFPEHFQSKLTTTIERNFLGFFWGRFLLSLFFGASTFIVFLLFQVPYALVLATIAGMFDLIPGIGATLGIALVSLILLPQGILLSLKILVSCILLQQVEENLLMPRIMQGSINLNPVVMFFALLVGARIAGLLGIFLSIPVAGVIFSLLEVEEIKAE
jgi:predicted PurR-regulated permease PerM